MKKARAAEHLPMEQLRKRVVVTVVLMLAAWCVATWIAYNHLPMKLPPMESASDRIVFAIRCNVPSVISIMVLIACVGNARFGSEQIDPLSPKDKHVVEVPQRVLQNTLEQFVVSLSLQLAASTWLTGQQMKLIPIIVAWFVLGRILFWVGYRNPDYGRTNRAYGFSLSMQPSAALAIYCTYKMLLAMAS